MASENEVRLQLKGGRSIKIIRTETPTGGMWSIPEMPEIAAHQNISVIRDRLRGKGLIASRPGEKATFKVEDRFYFGKGRKERFADDVTYSIAAHIGHEPVGHRSVRSLEEAKAIAKQMLASTKANAKGKPVLVEVYPVVNYSPKDAIVTLRG
jgi:hypothetical protein